MNCCNHENQQDQNNIELTHSKHHKKHHHGLMMIFCLIPMGLIFLWPLLNQTENSQSSPWTFLLVLLCPLMHIFMMFGMRNHDHTK